MRGNERRLLLDAVAVAWTLAGAAAGWVVYDQVLRLRQLSDSVVVAGRQLHQTSETIRSFRAIPFVGDDIVDVADNAETAARSALRSGRESRDAVHDVALTLALVVAAATILPVVLAWALLRFERPVRAP